MATSPKTTEEAIAEALAAMATMARAIAAASAANSNIGSAIADLTKAVAELTQKTATHSTANNNSTANSTQTAGPVTATSSYQFATAPEKEKKSTGIAGVLDQLFGRAEKRAAAAIAASDQSEKIGQAAASAEMERHKAILEATQSEAKAAVEVATQADVAAQKVAQAAGINAEQVAVTKGALPSQAIEEKKSAVADSLQNSPESKTASEAVAAASSKAASAANALAKAHGESAKAGKEAASAHEAAGLKAAAGAKAASTAFAAVGAGLAKIIKAGLDGTAVKAVLSAPGDMIGAAVQPAMTAVTGGSEAIVAPFRAMAGYVAKSNPAAVEKFTLATDDLMAVIGETLLPIFEAGTKVIREYADLLRTIEPVYKPLITATKKIVELFGRLLGPAFQIAIPIIETMGEIFEEAVPVLEMFVDAVETMVDGIIEIVNDMIESWNSMKAVPKWLEIDLIPVLKGMKRESSVGAAVHSASFVGLEDFGKNMRQAAFSQGTKNVADQQLAEQKEANKLLRRIAEKGTGDFSGNSGSGGDIGGDPGGNRRQADLPARLGEGDF